MNTGVQTQRRSTAWLLQSGRIAVQSLAFGILSSAGTLNLENIEKRLAYYGTQMMCDTSGPPPGSGRFAEAVEERCSTPSRGAKQSISIR